MPRTIVIEFNPEELRSILTGIPRIVQVSSELMVMVMLRESYIKPELPRESTKGVLDNTLVGNPT